MPERDIIGGGYRPEWIARYLFTFRCVAAEVIIGGTHSVHTLEGRIQGWR